MPGLTILIDVSFSSIEMTSDSDLKFCSQSLSLYLQSRMCPFQHHLQSSHIFVSYMLTNHLVEVVKTD